MASSNVILHDDCSMAYGDIQGCRHWLGQTVCHILSRTRYSIRLISPLPHCGCRLACLGYFCHGCSSRYVWLVTLPLRFSSAVIHGILTQSATQSHLFSLQCIIRWYVHTWPWVQCRGLVYNMNQVELISYRDNWQDIALLHVLWEVQGLHS